MSSDPTITPPPSDAIREDEAIQSPTPQVQFSSARWLTTGMVRVLYRAWTRVAARLFPENSWSERLAAALHIPLPDKLNMSWVTTHLAVGGRVRPADIGALAKVGITAVIDTRAEHRDDEQALARHHIELLYLPTPDSFPLNIEQLTEGASWASERMQQGGRVLVHCEHGVGRSVLLTCATLIYDGMCASDALALVQRKRWQAAPNHRQIVRLREFEDALRSRRKA
jgi:protein tyrosine phosphatase (PTP) superfamily phosphohydrolase (DUF442 family)